MDNTISTFNPADCFNCNSNDSVASVMSNPMMMADSRALAEDLVNDIVSMINDSGNRVSESPQEIENITQGLSSFIMEQAIQRVLDQGGSEESKESKKGGKTEGGGSGGGGSIFERLASALGRAMKEKANELIELAESVPNTSDGSVLEQSAKVTAAGQELNVLSQTYNSSINSLGSAASTAARKQ